MDKKPNRQFEFKRALATVVGTVVWLLLILAGNSVYAQALGNSANIRDSAYQSLLAENERIKWEALVIARGETARQNAERMARQKMATNPPVYSRILDDVIARIGIDAANAHAKLQKSIGEVQGEFYASSEYKRAQEELGAARTALAPMKISDPGYQEAWQRKETAASRMLQEVTRLQNILDSNKDVQLAKTNDIAVSRAQNLIATAFEQARVVLTIDADPILSAIESQNLANGMNLTEANCSMQLPPKFQVPSAPREVKRTWEIPAVGFSTTNIFVAFFKDGTVASFTKK